MFFKKLLKGIASVFIICILFTNNSFSEDLSANNLENLEEIILNQLYLRNSDINITYTGSFSELENTLDGIFNKDMYINSTMKSYMWSFNGYIGNINIDINAEHIITYDEELLTNKKIDEILEQIITSDMNVHQKIKAVNDWIVINGKYDTSLTNYSHYDLLYEGESVCNGYALLTYKMLKSLNIPVILITGDSKDQSHIWNMVEVDGLWFHLDTTWNDPIPDKPNEISYRYYLLSDAEIKKDHNFNDDYPKADTSYFNYLYNLSKSSSYSYKYKKLIEDLNLDIYYDDNTANSIYEFNQILSQKSKNEPNYIAIRCAKNIMEKVINSKLTKLYDNKNIKNIEYKTTDDKTVNYNVLEIYIKYKKQPEYLTCNIEKDIFLTGDESDLKIEAVYSLYSKNINDLTRIRPYNEDILTINEDKIYFNNIGKTNLQFDYCNKSINVPITVFNSLGKNYILDYEPKDKIKVKIFDKYILFDQPPIIENNRTLVPVRAIFEVLGCEVNWDPVNRLVTGTNNDVTIKLKIDHRTAYVNGEPVLLDVPAKILNKRTLVPIRFISESLNRKVDWDQSSETVIID